MIIKVVRVNYLDRRVFGDNLILYKVVLFLGIVKIRLLNIYGFVVEVVVFYLVCGVYYKSFE